MLTDLLEHCRIPVISVDRPLDAKSLLISLSKYGCVGIDEQDILDFYVSRGWITQDEIKVAKCRYESELKEAASRGTAQDLPTNLRNFGPVLFSFEFILEGLQYGLNHKLFTVEKISGAIRDYRASTN